MPSPGGDARPGARLSPGSASMKKHQPHSVQGTFSRLFGKRHSSPSAASLFATNPPWIFTQEVTSDSAGGTGQCPPRAVRVGMGGLGVKGALGSGLR